MISPPHEQKNFCDALVVRLFLLAWAIVFSFLTAGSTDCTAMIPEKSRKCQDANLQASACRLVVRRVGFYLCDCIGYGQLHAFGVVFVAHGLRRILLTEQ